jgi:hypothetical protein
VPGPTAVAATAVAVAPELVAVPEVELEEQAVSTRATARTRVDVRIEGA